MVKNNPIINFSSIANISSITCFNFLHDSKYVANIFDAFIIHLQHRKMYQGIFWLANVHKFASQINQFVHELCLIQSVQSSMF